MKRTIAIGDIHGCYQTLVALLSLINYNSADDQLIFLGDYIDRGLDACKTLRQIKRMRIQLGREKCVCLLGNHERMMIDALEKEDMSLWFSNGGMDTIESYQSCGEDFYDDITWLKTLPLYYENENAVYVHAGHNGFSIHDASNHSMLWSRNLYNNPEQKESQ